MISSLPTFIPRPIPIWGLKARRPAAIRSARPTNKPGGLRTSQRLAAGESDQVEALVEVFRKATGRGDVRSGVVENRDRMFLAGPDPILPLDLPQRFIPVQKEKHRRARANRVFELSERFNPHELCTEQEHLGLVAALVALLDDDLVLQPVGLGKFVDRGGVVAGHACGRGDGDRRGCSGCDHGGWDLEQPGNPLAHFFLELGDRDEPRGGLGHRLEHLGRHERAAQGRIGSLGVDQRLDAEFRVNVFWSSSHRSTVSCEAGWQVRSSGPGTADAQRLGVRNQGFDDELNMVVDVDAESLGPLEHVVAADLGGEALVLEFLPDA